MQVRREEKRDWNSEQREEPKGHGVPVKESRLGMVVNLWGVSASQSRIGGRDFGVVPALRVALTMALA